MKIQFGGKDGMTLTFGDTSYVVGAEESYYERNGRRWSRVMDIDDPEAIRQLFGKRLFAVDIDRGFMKSPLFPEMLEEAAMKGSPGLKHDILEKSADRLSEDALLDMLNLDDANDGLAAAAALRRRGYELSRLAWMATGPAGDALKEEFEAELLGK